MMKKIIAYKTRDNCVFESKEWAKRHELLKTLEDAGFEYDFANVLSHNADEILKILNEWKDDKND